MKLSFYTKTVINLSLENYHNAGLTPEETRSVIEDMYDPYGCTKFHCSPSGINSNWSISTYGPEGGAEMIVFEIQTRLDWFLEKKLKSEGVKEKK